MSEVIIIFISTYRLLIFPYFSTGVQWWCFEISSSWLKWCDKCLIHRFGRKFERKRFLRKLDAGARRFMPSSRIQLLVYSSSKVKIVPSFYRIILAPAVSVLIDRATSRLDSRAFFTNVEKLFLSLVWFIICVEIHLCIHPSVALQPFVGPWPLLQFRNLFLHRRQDSLNEWSARRKAATNTQDNTNTE
jgi:hypothetical protein